jgi:hypothetical protein
VEQQPSKDYHTILKMFKFALATLNDTRENYRRAPSATAYNILLRIEKQVEDLIKKEKAAIPKPQALPIQEVKVVPPQEKLPIVADARPVKTPPKVVPKKIITPPKPVPPKPIPVTTPKSEEEILKLFSETLEKDFNKDPLRNKKLEKLRKITHEFTDEVFGVPQSPENDIVLPVEEVDKKRPAEFSSIPDMIRLPQKRIKLGKEQDDFPSSVDVSVARYFPLEQY